MARLWHRHLCRVHRFLDEPDLEQRRATDCASPRKGALEVFVSETVGTVVRRALIWGGGTGLDGADVKRNGVIGLQ